MMHRFAPLKIAILLPILGILTACQFWQQDIQPKPHVIVVAVESLSFEMASCLEELDENDGFAVLCEESLRFTHVYSPSALSQSSLASLLTGKSPKEHRVFHNGRQFIPPYIHTISEQALQHGYGTQFHSGGPPILSKSGLIQGFEIFNDEFLADGGLYRPAQSLFKTALQTLKANKNEPQFLTLFVADLQFPFVATKSNEGREREKTIGAQRQELGESLFSFFQTLKKEKLWDQSYIFVLGLNGAPDQVRRGVLWRENLFRENIHVPVFIKTPSSDSIATTELVDQLMGLDDIGHLLHQVISTQVKTESSVKEWLAPTETKKYIEVRSDWGEWWFQRPPQLSLRTYENLIFPYEKPLRVYNSIEDRTESVALSGGALGVSFLKSVMESRPSEVPLDPQVVPPSWPELYVVLQKIHWNRYSKGSAPGDQIAVGKESSLSQSIQNDQLLGQKNWPTLLKVNDKDSLVSFVASENLGLKPQLLADGVCESQFNIWRKKRGASRCSDELFVSLLDWEGALQNGDEILTAEKNFIRKLRTFLTEKKIAYANLMNELNWDVDAHKYYGPSLTELYLSLPSKAGLRKKIEGYKVSLSSELL